MARMSKVQKEMMEQFEKDTECVVKHEEKIDKATESIIDYEATVDSLLERVFNLEVAVAQLLEKKPQGKSIQRVEKFNDEEVPEQRESSAIKMTDSDKIMSAKNAVKILPPNMIVDGRHSKENIGAICGFVVTDEMMEEIYFDFKHDLD